MDDKLIIRMIDVRKAGMCSAGVRTFFRQHNLDWQKFLREGIDSKELEEIDDVMVKQVIEVAKNGR